MAKRAPMRRWLVDYTDEVCASDLSAPARHVAMVLAKRADNASGAVHLKRRGLSPRAVIADMTGHSERTVTRALGELHATGWLARLKRGPWVAYTVTFPPGSRHYVPIGPSQNGAIKPSQSGSASRHSGAEPSQSGAMDRANVAHMSSLDTADVSTSPSAADEGEEERDRELARQMEEVSRWQK